MPSMEERLAALERALRLQSRGRAVRADINALIEAVGKLIRPQS